MGKGLLKRMTKIKEVQTVKEMHAYYWDKGIYLYCGRQYRREVLIDLAKLRGMKLVLTNKQPGDR